MYTFDKVVNDTYAESGGIEKLYNNIVRPKITQSAKALNERS